jgi:hypothetical protein
MPGVSEDELVARDAAQLLYLHGVGGIAVTAAASALVAIVPDPLSQPSLVAWLCVMALLFAVRAADVTSARRRRYAAGWSGRAETRRFGIGCSPPRLSGTHSRREAIPTVLDDDAHPS